MPKFAPLNARAGTVGLGQTAAMEDLLRATDTVGTTGTITATGA